MAAPSGIRAVLFDRDGTLIVDVPYNGDPALVAPMPGAVAAVRLARAAGLDVAVVSNQSGIGRAILTRAQVEAVNTRVDELVGPFDVWAYCPHAETDGCECRKPAPGLVLRACDALGVTPAEVVVIGDIGADIDAARAAGSSGVLVPTPATRAREVADAETVAPDLRAAVDLVLRAHGLAPADGVQR
ncbi:D-glycero-alpha-D-manno-heptose-1,7-bisphosphate 7-phosphatase [Microbacterium trichothecenolyticum]|uniref:D,D-heptose 1,7-bisphosphate phosphatase n=1 Tax=Microbacterium trichothecenolyticum TaxID=69370 RepID=A0ABU0TSI3_MICTR|nr:HAD-IIIA family hydrolase [Microbacterium trichothecenolyticum]MDQ1122608.1 D-glycero-D-manno-heptose 1,7-bisphosphate phosphatase [Microbacterium trichothecenolyticum]